MMAAGPLFQGLSGASGPMVEPWLSRVLPFKRLLREILYP
jgi:hypothetical protein